MKMHREAGLFISLLVLFSLSCSLVMPKTATPTATTEPTREVTATPRPTDTPPPSPSPTPTEEVLANFTITLENDSPYPICEVYITHVDAENWGEDWLQGERIAPGTSRRFPILEDEVDVEVWTCDGAVLTTFWELDQDAKLKVGASDLEPLRVTNSLGTDICSLYIADVETPDWGESWLPGFEVLEAGSERIFFLPQGLYDAMAEDCDGNIIAQVTLPVQVGGVDWEMGGQVAPGDRYIYIYNLSSYDICGVYMGPPESEFGPNLVESGALISFSPSIWAVEVDIHHPWVVLIEDCDGLRLDYNTEVYPGSTVVIGGEGLVSLEIYNYTDAPICDVYISPTTDDSWGENWLVNEVINPQQGARAFFVEPGTYDLLALDCDGNTLAEYHDGSIGKNGAYWELKP